MGKGISRRTVLAASALPVIPAMVAPAAAAATVDPEAVTVDVVICGGGLSGMTAALRLNQAGRSVVVLEADERLGGRTLTRQGRDGAPLDLGAQYVGPTQTSLLQLARDLGVATFRGYGPGDGLLRDRGANRRLPGGDLALEEGDLAEFARVAGVINAMAQTVPLEAPQDAPDALAWDAVTMRTWIDANARSPLIARFLDLVVTALLGCSADEVSLLFFAYYVHHGDSLEMLISTRGGAQDSRFVGGAQQFCTRIAERLERGSVVLRSPVRRIEQDGEGVTVRSDRATVRARRAIVAMPPAAADRIDFSPSLSADRRELQLRSPMGRYMKAIVTYARPFWRDQGLNGEALNLSGRLFGAFDESEPGLGSHALLGFAAADGLRELRALSAAERRAAVLDELAALFGDSARSPTDYVEYDWDENGWTRGGPVACLPPGALSRVGVSLRRPEGRVHWAGTEAAIKWTGYLEGAVRAGEAAASQAVAAP